MTSYYLSLYIGNSYIYIYVGVMLGSLWIIMRSLPGSFWERFGIIFGIILGLLWDQFGIAFGIILGSLWDHFLDHFGFISGSFWDLYGIILGIV